MPKREIDYSRLCQAIQNARQTLQKPRQERREAVKQLVGAHYAEEGTSERVPVNLLSLYVSVVGRNLIAKNPRVLLSTFSRQLKPSVSAMEKWANKQIEHMHLAETLQRVVTDALFSIGICKVALATPAESAGMAWSLRAGQPFAERVDLDDFVFDVHARSFEEVGYIGHRYRVPLDVVKDGKLYSKARKDLTASTDEPYNLEGDERVNMIGRGYYGDHEEFEEMVDLWEIYLPRHRKVLTFADDHMTGPAMSSAKDKVECLREQDWVGPDSGPYHILGFQVVPGNILPQGPIQNLVDLHEMVNSAYRKVHRAIERCKELTFVRGGAAEDGERVMKANDGDVIRVDSPEQIKQVVMGGTAMNAVMVMATAFKDLFSFMGGNLELLGGRGPQSKTATQDKLLNENAGAGIADMQDRTITFTSQAVESLCWYWWKDPFTTMKAEHAVQGNPNLSIGRKVTPEMRQRGNFDDLDIRVDPYSLQHSTPQSRMASLNQVVQTIVIPMAQLLQSQGVVFDVNAYLEKVAAYMDMPDLAEIITMQEPPEAQQGMPGAPGGAPQGAGPRKPPMPAQTNRTYTRENVAQRTEKGNNQNLVNSLLGVKVGGAQRNGQPK